MADQATALDGESSAAVPRAEAGVVEALQGEASRESRISRVWLFRYYSWIWLTLGPIGPDGRRVHQPKPYMPMRQEAMFE